MEFPVTWQELRVEKVQEYEENMYRATAGYTDVPRTLEFLAATQHATFADMTIPLHGDTPSIHEAAMSPDRYTSRQIRNSYANAQRKLALATGLAEVRHQAVANLDPNLLTDSQMRNILQVQVPSNRRHLETLSHYANIPYMPPMIPQRSLYQ